MSEMTEERLNEIERVIRQEDYSGSLRLKMAYHDITELVAEVRRLREAAKGQAIIVDQAGRRIRELERQNQKMKEVLRMFFRTCWQGDLDGGWVQDMGVEHGFLNEEIYDYDKHGDIDGLEPGDVIYTLSDELEEGK